MSAGFIYVLQNPVYDPYVVKIGFSKREPDLRARELYDGATGVPVPFEVASAYSVGDCKLAEKITHKRMASYRLNGRREFFRTAPHVAAAIAYDTCSKINEELGISPPEVYEAFEIKDREHSADECSEAHQESSFETDSVWHVDPYRLRESPMGTSTLTAEQSDRVEILKMQLAQVHPDKIEEMLSGFSRDKNPEKEIKIWECITKAYLTIEQVAFASDELRHEAFYLLLMRSWSPASKVLSDYKLKHLTLKAAKRLLRAYELKPMPISVYSRSSTNTLC
ncbi:GIY-YIG nuclease family protein [Pseudomonas monteilii]|uniref:GIY-YIG nuclease family protein n=1 Tax=Pseudomonas monteilii TaxID=76759 RepID=UPI001F35A474|nr:GIY-YIG nuclease family protein [Pseudomonas monteilii]